MSECFNCKWLVSVFFCEYFLPQYWHMNCGSFIHSYCSWRNLFLLYLYVFILQIEHTWMLFRVFFSNLRFTWHSVVVGFLWTLLTIFFRAGTLKDDILLFILIRLLRGTSKCLIPPFGIIGRLSSPSSFLTKRYFLRALRVNGFLILTGSCGRLSGR